MIGTTVAHFTILQKLGEGGMGVVYKAQDLQLDRLVALKFMPHHLSPDQAEEARFLQEAKAASALNHPNVCTIYGFHLEEGTRFIVMEYVEGPTLRQTLPVQPLTQAIAYGVQIADALHEAHQKGIVHRDIKADNVMINPRNQVKVMDFGLAKLKGSLKLTRATSTVGTLAYMAPEQIQGGDADARSDIFSFGVLLYEMLTGRLPFRSEHEAALMYSIINDEPEQIQKHCPDLSPVLANVIHRALEKDPDDRFQSINEMTIELRRLQKHSTRVSRTSLPLLPAPEIPADVPDIPAATPASRVKARLLRVGWAVLAGAAAFAALWIFVVRPAGRVEVNPNMSFRTLQIPFQEIGYSSLARDGGWVAFPAVDRRGMWDLYLMNSNSGEPRRITNDSSGWMQEADLSPDGSQIVYDRADKGFTRPEIALVSSLGGSSKRLVSVGVNPRWRPDGKRIAYLVTAAWGSPSGFTQVRSITPNGTDDRAEFSDSSNTLFSYCWSPDMKSMAFTRRVAGGHYEIFLRDLASGTLRQLTALQKEIGSLTWNAQEEIIFSGDLNGNTNLWMIPAAGGTPVQITRGSGPDLNPAVSADLRRLLYVQQQSIGHLWLASLRDGAARQLTFDDANLSAPAFSNDGKRIAYVVTDPHPSGTISSLTIMDREGGEKTVLLTGEGNVHAPLWSDNGRWIAYAAHADTVPHDEARTYLIEAENPNGAREIGRGLPTKWLDERTVLTQNVSGTWACSVDGGPPQRYFRDSTYATPVLGGRYILYADVVPSRRSGVWIEPSSARENPGAGPKQLIKSLSSYQIDPAGAFVYYVSPQNTLRRVRIPDGKDEPLPGAFPGLRRGAAFCLSPDGQSVTYLDSRTTGKLVMIDDFH